MTFVVCHGAKRRWRLKVLNEVERKYLCGTARALPSWFHPHVLVIRLAAFFSGVGAGAVLSLVRHKGEMTLEALQEFEKKYFAGELEQHFKSEVLSPGDNTGPLKVVKGQTFKSMVIDSGASATARASIFFGPV